jgi:surfactin synthase thioesterase subunit
MNLICLPFAGGSSYSYFGLKKNLSPKIKMITPELPGRGSRLSEPLVASLPKLMSDTYSQLLPLIKSGEQYSIYGHSMGTILGYLLIQRIETESLPLPVHFFASGRAGMSVIDDEPMRYNMERNEFIEKLKGYGGAAIDIIDDENIMNFFEPILRADFEAVETYKHNFESAKINVPITVMFGSEEKITPEEAFEWKNDTLAEISIHEFKGNHFFIYDHWNTISKLIMEKTEIYLTKDFK